MKKKRGLSQDEKRNIMLSLFKKNPTFFHYKEIETYCTKNKISFMIVKDLLQGLVADSLVETEKIGSSAYYWALPTRILKAKENILEREKKNKETLGKELSNLRNRILEAKTARQDTQERRNKLEEMEKLLKQKADYEKIIADFEEKDPDIYEKYIKGVKDANNLYDFWIDNLYGLEKFIRNAGGWTQSFVDLFPDVKELGFE